MPILEFTLIILVGSCFAGLLGSLTGLGGGFIIIPLLTVFLHVDIHYAIGASLVSIIATSSGSAAAYVKEGITNMRLGMFLEVATTLGAVTGAMVAVYFPTNLLAILLGLILITSALLTLRKKAVQVVHQKNILAEKLKFNGSYPGENGTVEYSVSRIGGGFVMMLFAGLLSGLLGIGSGALKVLAMDNIMRIPFKVSTTTSNFMIGVTGAASAVVYLQRGYIEPSISMPVVIGVLTGALVGSKILVKTKSSGWLRWVFVVVVIGLASQLIYNGLIGKI
jgi:uncharacterized membrane protein YfcA